MLFASYAAGPIGSTCPGAVDGAARQMALPAPRGCSSMVEQKPSKLTTRVRFPSPAPKLTCRGHVEFWSARSAAEGRLRTCRGHFDFWSPRSAAEGRQLALLTRVDRALVRRHMARLPAPWRGGRVV